MINIVQKNSLVRLMFIIFNQIVHKSASQNASNMSLQLAHKTAVSIRLLDIVLDKTFVEMFTKWLITKLVIDGFLKAEAVPAVVKNPTLNHLTFDNLLYNFLQKLYNLLPFFKIILSVSFYKLWLCIAWLIKIFKFFIARFYNWLRIQIYLGFDSQLFIIFCILGLIFYKQLREFLKRLQLEFTIYFIVYGIVITDALGAKLKRIHQFLVWFNGFLWAK